MSDEFDEALEKYAEKMGEQIARFSNDKLRSPEEVKTKVTFDTIKALSEHDRQVRRGYSLILEELRKIHAPNSKPEPFLDEELEKHRANDPHYDPDDEDDDDEPDWPAPKNTGPFTLDP